MFVSYLVVGVFAVIASIASVNRGSFFTEKVKAILLCLLVISIVVTSVFMAINYSWIHILGLIATALITSWVSSFVWCSIFYKGTY